MVRERSNTLRRNTTSQTARLQRRGSISGIDTSAARRTRLRNSLKRKKLDSLAKYRELTIGQAQRGNTYDLIDMDAGQTQLVYFRDNGGENVYVKLPDAVVAADRPAPDQLETLHAGELAQAALDVGRENSDGRAVQLGRIVIASNNDADHQRLTDEVHSVFKTAEVVFVRTDQPGLQIAPPPAQPRPANANAALIAARPTPVIPTFELPMMTSADFNRAMGDQPKENSKHAAISAALDQLHTAARAVNGNLGSERINRTPNHELLKTVAGYQSDLADRKADAKLAIATYLEDSKHFKVKKSTLERFGRKDLKMDVVSALNAALDGVDVDRLIVDAKNALIMRRFAPLTEADIDPNGPEPVLGEGAGGPVRAKTYLLNPPGNAPATFLAATKLDGTEATVRAKLTGVPVNNPQESLRAVAVYRFDQALGLNLVPTTTFAVVADAASGDLRLGQALEVVDGTDGQVDVLGPALDADVAASYANVSDVDLRTLQKKRVPGDPPTVHELRMLPVAVDYRSVVVQKSLNDMQIFDNIIGHPDRHGGNFRFTVDPATGAITGVKTLDNDDALGFAFAPMTGDFFNDVSVTPPIPPVVDFHTALKVLSAADPTASVRGLLSTQDQAALVARLNDAQSVLRERLANGDFVTSEPVTLADRAALSAALPGVTWELFQSLNGASLEERWGDGTYDRNQSADPKERVSYLGEIISRANSPGVGFAWPAYSVAGVATHFGPVAQVAATQVPAGN